MPAQPATGIPDEPFVSDGAREALAPVLGLRPLVWKRAAPKTARDFDTGLYFLNTLIDTLRWRSDVDSESSMERMLPEIEGRMGACGRALRELGESGASDALAKALDEISAPVMEHLARMRSAQRVHSGPSAALKLSIEEYLILCVQCQAPAERLRVYADSVSFSRHTGAVPAPYYPRERAAELFSTLERDGADALCAGLEERGGRKIIGYCPDCRALYCPAHYETRETWSGSWLEALHGTCAKGHRREIA